ncbi:MAG: FHA domain-containing protein [Chloroflexi bacterium]|nr:FHA domain-containing protein [Chloroflexota bacterium]
MSLRLRSYYYAVLGALGALIGWRITDTFGFVGGQSVYLSDVLLGAVIGLCLGVLIGASEGLLTRSWYKALRAGALAGGIGMIAGAIGLPLGEFIFQATGGELIGRALGWGVFALLIGLSEGITGGTQMWKGAVGGLIGGVVGGVILFLLQSIFGITVLGKMLGLAILGAAVGVFIALMVVLLSRAWLEVKSGKLKGTEFILDKFMPVHGPAAIIGSNDFKADIAIPDPDMAPQHARLKGAGTHFVLEDMSVGKGTFVNGRRVEMARLTNNATIRVGNTELVYHEKR